ncbi:hypothetical protein QE109_10150 [Fusibacter bizertensis]|uniref:N-acetyltransferase domain-containing protein n=1 Tax=Fusibacter bizertensis TaxID=1488331 RepID=A0ABT6NDK8_9FIRM|nr:hypothetical protein [Fusibacter bizertensis]MDH8678509.1 hypothetical protein [Fusibacter bizertensis]
MILEQGYIIKRKATIRQEESYTMRLVEAKEINAIMNLQHKVYEGLPNKQVLYKDTRQEMLEDLSNGAMVIGVYNSQEQLISYRYISFPGHSLKNLGNDIHLDNSELDRVVHLETTLVSPDYRGNKLQAITLSKAIELIKPLEMKHLICTVSPYNLFSLYNIMSAGLNIKSLKRKYASKELDGMWRFILHKDMSKSFSIENSELKMLKMDKIFEQKNLIEKGYVGYNLIKDSQMIQYSLSQ